MVSIFSTYEFYRAGWVKSHLEEQGIEVMIKNRNADLIPTHMITPYEILVSERDLERALELIYTLNIEE